MTIDKSVLVLGVGPDQGLGVALCKKFANEGYKVFPYTINNPRDIEEMLNLKVDGIITDFPERVKKALSSN